MARYITLPRISFCQLAEIHKTNNHMLEQLFASAGKYFSLFYCLNGCTLHIYKDPMHSRDENSTLYPLHSKETYLIEDIHVFYTTLLYSADVKKIKKEGNSFIVCEISFNYLRCFCISLST